MQQGTDTKAACFRQRVLQGAERIHGGGEWIFSAGTTTSAPTDRRRESNIDLQEPFHCRNGVNTQRFPLHLWCRILPQASVTLNLLRPSRTNPTLSAHAQLYVLFDFNATIFAPLGTKVIVHLKPTIRRIWAPRGQDGWYIDRAKDHYRCYNIYIPETRAVIQPDTVEFLPHNCKMPFLSSAKNATIAATELIHALRNQAPAAPYAHIGDVQLQALD